MHDQTCQQGGLLGGQPPGRGFRLTESQREQLFEAMQAYQQRLLVQQVMDWWDVPRRYWHWLEEGEVAPPQYDVVLVDEAQVFAPVWFDIVRRLGAPELSYLFLAADSTQGFLRRGESWRAMTGLEVRGRTYHLRRSYRTTRAILTAALAFYRQRLPEEEPDLLLPDLGNMERGCPPRLLRFSAPQDERARVVDEIVCAVEKGLLPRHVLVLHASAQGAEALMMGASWVSVEIDLNVLKPAGSVVARGPGGAGRRRPAGSRSGGQIVEIVGENRRNETVNAKRKRSSSNQRAARDQDSQPFILWIHGLACLGDERWEEAISTFRQFMSLDIGAENRASAYFNISACYAAQERYDKALEMLEKAQQYAPDDPETLRSRAITYACAGRISEAISAFKTFRRRWGRYARQSDTAHTLRKLDEIKRGELPASDYLVDYLQEQVSHNTELGDFHLVEAKARRMIEANPDRPEGHFALGLACLEQERYTEALDPFLTAHTCDPDYTPTLHNIGHTYLQLDQPKEAISWLKRAYESDPEHLGAMYQLGVAYARLKKPEVALTWWRRVLEHAPDHYSAQARVYEIGEGPEPTEPPLPPQAQQIKRMKPLVKANMRHPRVYRNGGVVLTYDHHSFVLEDAENPANATLYSGVPVSTRKIPDYEEGYLLDLIGMVKMLLSLINAANTRQVAILAYYDHHPVFQYETHFAGGERVSLNTSGQFIVTEVPRFFKLKIDSDLSTPYGDPMQGMLIYLNQRQRPGLLLSTLPRQG